MYLLIVARARTRLYEQLTHECPGQPELRVVLDRRAGPPPPTWPPERDRRRNEIVQTALATAGWAVVELEPAAGGPTPARRLLVVDDDARVRDMLQVAFAREYDVETAADGVLGLAKAVLRRPDVVLLDVRIPDVDGLLLLRCLQKLDPSIPVIVITGSRDVAVAAEVIQQGVFSYVPKPFDLEYLRHLVATVVASGGPRVAAGRN
jgi:CheY-like chemotaxis protein